MFLARDIGASAPGPTDDFWYMPLSGRSAAGARVTPETSMRLSTVYKCVRVIAETVGMLPCKTYRRLDGGDKELAEQHPLAPLLSGAPNPWQTQMEWRELMQGHAVLRGNGYSRIIYDGAGRVDMFLPMHPDRTQVEAVGEGKPPRYRYTDRQGRESVLVFGEVLHLRGPSSDGYVGMNPIELHREAIGSAIAKRDYGSRYFANDARFPGWIEFSGKFADTTAKRQFRESFQAAQSGANAGKVAVLEHGMKYHELGVKNTDAEYIASSKLSEIDIAGIFRVQPHKIGILDRATWSNIEHQALEFVTDTIMPWAVRWEQALQLYLDFGDGFFPELLLDMLLRGDTKTRYEAYGKGIQDGWLTRNEARRRENLNRIEGLDKPLEPLNMAPAGSRRASQERGEPPDARQRLSAERSYLIERAAAERVARKERAALERMGAGVTADMLGDFYTGHVGFVADVMAVSREAADEYCAGSLKRLLELHAAGTLGQLLLADWTDRQVAALLRLGDH